MPKTKPETSVIGLDILVVDDSPEITLLVSSFLRKMGHRPSVADNGRDAIRMLENTRPDLILLDVMMPEMDGFQTAEHIKTMGIDGWIPLIFLTANTEDNGIVRGIQVGGDDYLIKPISFVMLKAKLDAFSRMLDMQRQIEQKNVELEFYYHAAENEQRIANDLMNRMVRVDMLQDHLLSYWIRPAHNISGDLVAAARTPHGALHVLLADGTGHGLAASINVLPLAEPFYQMTAQGYGITAIITELNVRAKKWLPVDRFVAATLVAYNPFQKLIEVWVGGNPSPFLVDRRGHPIHHFSKIHFPLGIVSKAEFDSQTELLQFNGDGQLVLFSDGAVEAINIEGTQFDRAALLRTLHAVPPADRMAHLQKTLTDHLHGTSSQDDISIAIIDCISELPPQNAGKTKITSIAHPITNAGWRVQLTLTAQELKYVDVVPMLLELVQRFHSEQHHGALFLIISELFNNALDHGVLELDSSLKQKPDGIEQYLELRQSRLAALRNASIHLSLEIVSDDNFPALNIEIKDSGNGFNYAYFLNVDPSGSIVPHGRGIPLVRRMCATLAYRGCGNEVSALYRLNSSTDEAGSDKEG